MTTWGGWHALSQEPGLYVYRVGGAVTVLVLTLLLARVLGSRVHHTLQRTSLGPNPTVLLARATRSAVYLIGLLWILGIFSVPFTALAAVVSVTALALSLSLQDLLKNLIAGLYLLAERPFHIGDEITVSGVTGVIDDIQMRVTFLHTERGERVIMPNQTVFTQVITNNTLAGSRAASLVLEIPRTINTNEIAGKVESTLRELASLAPAPWLRFHAIGMTADASRWSLTVWLRPDRNLSEVVLALGSAIPEITIAPPS